MSLTKEEHLEPKAVETLAQERFGVPLRDLNKLQASGLIDELLEKHGKRNGNRSGNRRVPEKAGAR